MPTNDAKPPTRAEQARTDESAELRRLREENESLRAQLRVTGSAEPAKPTEPSFGISEGTRDELERNGEANSPFTGKRLTKSDLPKKSDTK